ncbi:DUF2625 domain-containing protein [Flavihumibacter rivuli]|uniref:DUF2625 domain-containing protein n=1 Tax=Flavihumibacter rivuli TaxID=2838156 RepID=UPI001BDF4A89|nr:DUF2625 domain-containing protein [Flavihumibacter rivuli]ULQ55202.1 DUF2625 domain-containing protein [Flavihumibacter rivuli]
MRSLDLLIDTLEPAWPIVNQWIDSASNYIEVLPANPANARTALFNAQVTTRSPMGTIVFRTGGILIDSGWIRILGSGHPKLPRCLPDWNRGKAFKEYGEPPPFLLIADDAIGGFFLLNGGGLGNDPGKIYYFSPDNLNYEPLDLTYTEFLDFCFNGNLDEFYRGLRWPQWKEDLRLLNGDSVFSFYPFLWTKEGKDITKSVRKVVPVEEQFQFNLDMRKQLGH